MAKKIKYDEVISISLSKAQLKKAEKKSVKFNGNLSAVFRELIDKIK